MTEYGQQILDQQWLHTAVVKLGLDETAFLAATATSHTQFVTGLVDLAPAGGGPARLLDVVEGRSARSSPTGSPSAVRTGAPTSKSPRSIRSAAMRPHCAPDCRRPPWCWTPSTP